jgi:hypothetical protein
MNAEHKINKYLSKLKNNNVNTENFSIYLTKLNQWYANYEQFGGKKKSAKLELAPPVKEQSMKTLLLREDHSKYNYCNIKHNNIYFVIVYKNKPSTGSFDKKSLKTYLNEIFNVNVEIDDYNKCLGNVYNNEYVIFKTDGKLSTLNIAQDELTANYMKLYNEFNNCKSDTRPTNVALAASYVARQNGSCVDPLKYLTFIEEEKSNNFSYFVDKVFSYYANNKIGLITVSDMNSIPIKHFITSTKENESAELDKFY